MALSNRSIHHSVLPVIIEEDLSDCSIRIPRKYITLKSLALKSSEPENIWEKPLCDILDLYTTNPFLKMKIDLNLKELNSESSKKKISQLELSTKSGFQHFKDEVTDKRKREIEKFEKMVQLKKEIEKNA